MYFSRRDKHGDEVTVPAHFDAKHAEAGLGAVECHALDKTGQRLAVDVDRSPLGHEHISLPPGDNQRRRRVGVIRLTYKGIMQSASSQGSAGVCAQASARPGELERSG